MEYVKRAAPARNEVKQLLFSYVKLYRPVSKDTISLWIKPVLSSTGLHVTKFEGQGVHAASTSILSRNHRHTGRGQLPHPESVKKSLKFISADLFNDIEPI